MKYNHDAAEKALSRLAAYSDEYLTTDDDVKTIRHALAMMQKLEEPSEGMLKEIEFQCNCSIPSASYALKALLEAGRKEIDG